MSLATSAIVNVDGLNGSSAVKSREYPKGVPLLIIDDDVEVRTMIRRSLRKFNIDVVEAGTVSKARRLLKRKGQEFSFVFLDKCLPDGDGVEFSQEIRELRPDLSVAIITGMGSGEEAHQALEEGGVYAYVPKPILVSTIREFVTRRYPGLLSGGAVNLGPLVDGTDGVVEDPSMVRLIAHSPAMISVSIDVSRIAKMGGTPVIIVGETGAGKEVVAQLIHQRSSRVKQKFVAVNCGAIAHDLAESQFFGHVKGAFTGANNDHKGFFEEADGGTIFLDEITETTPAFQVKLLRVLQEGCITRVGSSQETKLDVRVLAATNRNLIENIDASGLRKDVYYRLLGSEIFLPPLRERPEDIIPLAVYFALKAARVLKKKLWFSMQVFDALMEYSWPGNVRELARVMEGAVGKANDIILVSDLRDSLRVAVDDLRPNEVAVIGLAQKFKTLDEVEEEQVRSVLRAVGGNLVQAANVLGRSPSTFAKRCRAKGWVVREDDLDGELE
jgi:DNA-binding NtrC family response regulator